MYLNRNYCQYSLYILIIEVFSFKTGSLSEHLMLKIQIPVPEIDVRLKMFSITFYLIYHKLVMSETFWHISNIAD